MREEGAARFRHVGSGHEGFDEPEAESTRKMNRVNHQNSAREARPEKVKYLAKQVRTASPIPMRRRGVAGCGGAATGADQGPSRRSSWF